MKHPRLLDLYCGAGGAAAGYFRAGFDVVGVDIKPQPRYPYEFHQGDALTFPLTCSCGHGTGEHHWKNLSLGDNPELERWCLRCSCIAFDGFDAIHASPPCQAYTSLKSMPNAREHPDLVAPTRERLVAAGVPYVIENVPGAPLLYSAMLCGSMFRLGCEGAELRRHRHFETSFPLLAPSSCVHGWSGKEAATVGVYGHAGGYSARQRYNVIGVYGGHGVDRRRRKNGQHFSTALRAEAMQINWMTGAELSQAIPPIYTLFIGEHLMAAITAEATP